MQIEVDQQALSQVAVTVDAAATAVATLWASGLADLPLDVALAMPGSGATPAAAVAATVFGDAVAALAGELAGYADAIREAAVRYRQTDDAVVDAAASR